MNKTILAVIITAVVIGGAAFYGGMKYDQSQTPQGGGSGNFSNLTPEERQQRIQQFGGGNRGGGQGGGGFLAGEIISKDSASITIKTNDGSSKIVFTSDATKVMQSTAGSLDNLAVGKQVTVNGSANQDGSIIAQTIQIRPQQNVQ